MTNARRPKFVIVYKDSNKFIYFATIRVDWGDEKTTWHYLKELPISEFEQFVSDISPVQVPQNYF